MEVIMNKQVEMDAIENHAVQSGRKCTGRSDV